MTTSPFCSNAKLWLSLACVVCVGLMVSLILNFRRHDRTLPLIFLGS